MSFFIMRLFLYYTQSDLKQVAKLIDGWERGRGGGLTSWVEAWKDVWKGVFLPVYIVLRLQNTLGF